jgi:hypothetical protein
MSRKSLPYSMSLLSQKFDADFILPINAIDLKVR